MIGVLGGTFDPIHFGHLRPALEVHEQLRLDELRFVPCHVPPHREEPATPARHRLAMVERAVAGVPGFRADRRELDRAGPSYTVDTLRDLRAEIGPQAPLVLIMGMDAFSGLHTWHRWRAIPALAHVVVAHRPGAETPPGTAFRRVADIAPDPEPLRNRPCGLFHFQPVTQLDISATAIRGVLQTGRSARYLLPDSVCAYIDEHGLYPVITRETRSSQEPPDAK
ncbi:Nicotinate-nucleotide adenylyltransferase [Thioalkalivibrio nitratireducens DSM 14787]|uniref:Probable nicotinate-nucleotide adenylyltransferase n=1 Tax=Thioalkalivibrio nitratireducens (strain DSM 14787 / UNIQEM 213 / ALEN2) TaxID=1255043 RepID=L0DYN5_THIND|nr:nicotinate-nucleotide adenylyltransferase [Thioalkalivibrio nitratireducens]AGA34163.1 Nicotinate-nucleotide adenylyltransferase [Thioalkalivibrio nitratireducens DSM 14787]